MNADQIRSGQRSFVLIRGKTKEVHHDQSVEVIDRFGHQALA
jgi:hypothetical protein